LLLTSTAWLSAACANTSSTSSDSPGDSGATLPDSGGGSSLDARESDAADAPVDADAATCPALGMPSTFDQMVAYLCTNPQHIANWGVARGTVACDGLLGVVDRHGADAEELYLFDPITRGLVEALSGHDGYLTCLGSTTGIDRTTDPAFRACYVDFTTPTGNDGGAFGFQEACSDAGPDAAPEAGLTDAPPE
jgi:hypothetical protein